MQNKKLKASLIILVYFALLFAFFYKMLPFLVALAGGLPMLILTLIVLLILLFGIPIFIWRKVAR